MTDGEVGGHEDIPVQVKQKKHQAMKAENQIIGNPLNAGTYLTAKEKISNFRRAKSDLSKALSRAILIIGSTPVVVGPVHVVFILSFLHCSH